MSEQGHIGKEASSGAGSLLPGTALLLGESLPHAGKRERIFLSCPSSE